MTQSSEFTVQDAYHYDRRDPIRWIFSHVWRYWPYTLVALSGTLGIQVFYSGAQRLIGNGIAAIVVPEGGADALPGLALSILGLLLASGLSSLMGGLCYVLVSTRVEADARKELYGSLLGKNQAFHDRQRVGDIMARATDDTSRLSDMLNPGLPLLWETMLGLVVPLTYIATIRLQMLLVPLCFVAAYIISVRAYMGRLGPIIRRQREQFGAMNAGLEESISGIEVVKASARELLERAKFRNNARRFRDLFVMQGETEARYLPLLFYGFMVGLTFLHGMYLFQQSQVGLGDLIGIMALVGVLRFPTFISIFSFSLIQAGLSSARRILAIISAETDLDENTVGHRAAIKGEIVFDHVGFGYGDGAVLQDISFRVAPGQTVAIVGQTGSGKSALTRLVNRTYDATGGRVLIDGVDVREWSLDALRSQISKIEQDVFLFSRTLRENVAFGAPGATQEQVEGAARAAQAHDFIAAMPEGYDTVVGERGVTLSGGQRQRVALARAFLSDPRILILDDSTSAIDSRTEDEIQRAIRHAQEGRTTLLITHRISQIRWADLILVLDGGRIVAQGTHEQLLRRSLHYRRIFARYDADLPPLEGAQEDAPVAVA